MSYQLGIDSFKNFVVSALFLALLALGLFCVAMAIYRNMQSNFPWLFNGRSDQDASEDRRPLLLSRSRLSRLIDSGLWMMAGGLVIVVGTILISIFGEPTP